MIVYVCDVCGARHRQLFLLEHDPDCPPDSGWHIEDEDRPDGLR